MGYDEDFLKQIQKNKIGLEDTFYFGCTEDCQAKCCFSDTQMIFQPYDVFRIARHFGQPLETVIKDNLVVYMGSDSKLPICSMKYKSTGACRFLRKKKCSLHGTDAKPWSCIQYPLGRFLEAGSEEYVYFTQPQHCGNREPHIVKEWLGDPMLREEIDKASFAFSKAITELSMYCRSIKDPKLLEKAQFAIFMATYVAYDTAKDYVEQLDANIKHLQSILQGFKRNK
jgi:Fe-S-cluster containining protein